MHHLDLEGIDQHLNRRYRMQAIPDDIAQFLNANQARALKQLESFGYRLKFIRRPLFQTPVVVVENLDADRFGILDEDGQLDMNHGLIIRP